MRFFIWRIKYAICLKFLLDIDVLKAWSFSLDARESYVDGLSALDAAQEEFSYWTD